MIRERVDRLCDYGGGGCIDVKITREWGGRGGSGGRGGEGGVG